MAKRSSLRIVVDASIAGAAGVKGATPRSKACRDFLAAFMEQGHRLAFSPQLRKEWQDHAGPFAMRWRAEMVGKKLFAWVDLELPELRHFVGNMEIPGNRKSAIEKDCHLIEMALASDKRITSLDDLARDEFRLIAESLKQLKPIVWVNPEREEESAVDWLRNGAKADKSRLLGHAPRVG